MSVELVLVIAAVIAMTGATDRIEQVEQDGRHQEIAPSRGERGREPDLSTHQDGD